MVKIIEISDEDYSALLDVSADPNNWLTHVISATIGGLVRERRNQPGWMTVAVSFAASGGDPEDEKGVLLHGLSTGLFKDAATRYVEAIAVAKTAFEEDS